MSLDELKRQRIILKQLNTKIRTTQDGLHVMGSRINLQSQKDSNKPPPEGQNTSLSPHNPWEHMLPHQEETQGGSLASSRSKKLLVTLRGLEEQPLPKPMGVAKGKGMKVTLNASQKHPRHRTAQESEERGSKEQKLGGQEKKKLVQGGRKTRSNSKLQPKGKRKDGGKAVRSAYLAKKYYSKWSRYVFGRVPPSIARCHHMVQCGRKILREWQQVWWVEQREWKLKIRAECHDRYRLWIKVWNAWTRFILHTREKKKRRMENTRFAERRLLGQAWGGWRRYLQRKKTEKERKEYAEQWHLDTIKRTGWNRWRNALDFHHQMQAMEAAALDQWATNLQMKTLCQWKARYNDRIVMSMKISAASSCWAKRLKQTSIRAWLNYVEMKRRESDLTRVAEECYNSTAKAKYFCIWKKQFGEVRWLAQFQELINNKHKTAICGRMLTHWKFYITVKKHKTHLKELARLHYSLTLKAKCLHSFSVFLELRRRMTCDKQLALEFHVRTKLHQVWSRWFQRCEDNEEISLGLLTRQARAHHALKLTQASMGVWLIFVKQRRESKKLKEVADNYFKRYALPKYFEAFREHVSISRYKKNLMEKSEEFRRETLLSMGFYKWWRGSQLSQDVRMLERVALLHREEVIKRNLLVLWRKCTQERLLHHEQEEAAISHWVESSMSACFTLWRKRWESRENAARRTEMATQHFSMTLKRKGWGSWKQYLRRERESQSRHRSATEHYSKLLLSKILQSWKVYHKRACVKKAKTASAIHLHHSLIKKNFFKQWKEFVRQRKQSRELFRLSVVHYSHAAIVKHFVKWVEFTRESRLERQREDEEVRMAVAELTRKKALRVIKVWRIFVHEKDHERYSVAKADRHYCHLLQYKVFMAWHSRYQMALRKQLLRRQGAWFQRTRILSKFYLIWRVQLMYRLEEKPKTIESLWHWSQILQEKVVRAWASYAAEKKRKRGRYIEAMGRHRAWLMGVAVRKWIKVATHRRAQREEEAITRQTKETQRVLQCVKKCAHHWRELTVKHRPPPKQTTSFPIHPSSYQPFTTNTWSTLARKLHLPETVPVNRPQPRRPDFLASSHHLGLGEALPRLIPPPAPQRHMELVETQTNNEKGRESLDVSAETVQVDHTKPSTSFISTAAHYIPSQLLQSRGRGVQGAPSQLPSSQSSPLRGRGIQGAPSQLPPSQSFPLGFRGRGVQGPLPESHPLRNKGIHDEIISMRQEMKQFLELKLQKRSLQEQLSRVSEGERKKLWRELERVETQIQNSQPVVRQVATKINKLLQLCTTS